MMMGYGTIHCGGCTQRNSNSRKMRKSIDEKDSQEDYVEEEIFSCAGYLFDSYQASQKATFTFSPSLGTYDAAVAQRNICVTVECIDDIPGALQSGHYIWPASPALAQYLVDTYHSSHSMASIKRIIELGAGCGLVSLCAYQVFTDSTLLVVTDHDPGTLKRAKSNFESIKNNKDTNKVTRVVFEDLSWCDSTTYFQNFLNRLQEESNDWREIDTSYEDVVKFDLILGSDLIYCQDIVRPLLTTVALLLRRSNKESKMILSQSFNYSETTEEEIDYVCEKLNMRRQIIVPNENTRKSKEASEVEKPIRIQEITFCQ
jgi:predicted nicotinamide N-methyase